MLELRGISKSFADTDGGRWRLADSLDLELPQGQVLAVLGPSGSGKSTLLKMVAGLEQPDAGSIRFAGADLAGVPPERRGFALMFQDFALFPHLDVLDNVAFGLVEQRLPRAEARRRAAQPRQARDPGDEGQAHHREQNSRGGVHADLQAEHPEQPDDGREHRKCQALLQVQHPRARARQCAAPTRQQHQKHIGQCHAQA
ncbi:MAG: ATP-binding cassette domain-containing protein, partial [Burkholderiaceae bacterium]